MSFLHWFTRRHAIWALISIVPLMGLLALGNFMPKKFLFECKGHTVRLETGTTFEEVRKDRFFDTEVVRLYEYFWGLDFSINDFRRTNCSFLEDSGEIYCSQGEFGETSYRDASLNLYTRTHSYEWSSQKVKYSSDIDWTCEKTSSLIED